MGTWSHQDVASLVQLREAGLSYDQVRWRIQTGRWQSPLRGVVVLHSGPPTPRQRQWAAVLWAGEESALCAATAAELNGLRGYAESRIHVCVPSHQRLRATSGIVVHRSTTLRADELVPGRSPRRVCAERAMIELTVGKLRSDDACAVLAAGVQQGLVTADELLERVKADRHLRHRGELLDALADIAGGSESHAELLAIRLIRRARLPEPRRQASVVVEGVPKIVDLYWDDFDAGAEILGGFHREVAQWWKDLRRNAEIQTTGTMLVQLPAVALRREPDAAMDLLRRFLVSRGWRPEPETRPKDGLKVVLQSPRKSILRRGYVEG
ncbi:MAG: hypothetical protein QOJ11_3199 [Frankiales bacterium]|jgi:hypothetical protein|nr:hypothetical protein [Frankiales bacterium]